MPERTEIISGHDGGPIAVWWRRFAAKHRLIAQFVMFYAFSLFVTILQYVMLTYCPTCSTRTPTGAIYHANSSI